MAVNKLRVKYKQNRSFKLHHSEHLDIKTIRIGLEVEAGQHTKEYFKPHLFLTLLDLNL